MEAMGGGEVVRGMLEGLGGLDVFSPDAKN